MLVNFVDMQLRLQQVQALAHNIKFYLHYMSVTFIRNELQKYIFRYILISTNCDHTSNKKNRRRRFNLSKYKNST
jgi:hypothetical protein